MSVRPDENEKIEIKDCKSVTKENCEEIVIIKENILEIYVAQLKFTHHPLFSIEHVLAEKLCNLHDQYTLYIKNNNINRIKTQLEALRYLKKNMESRNEFDEGTSKRIVKVDRDIQKIRKMYFEEGRKERENLKDILITWKQIKKLREKQNFSNTNIKLLIKKEKVHYETDSLKYNKEFDETFNEIVKENRIAKREKSENKIQSVSKDLEDTNLNTNEMDIIREDLENLFHQSFRAPGEPVLKLSLSKNNEITKVVDDSKEINRRNAVKSTKIHLNISCDNVSVCKTKPVDLKDDFILDINEPFSIQLREVPKCLNFEVIEQQKGLARKKICEIIVTVPMQNFSCASNKPVKTTFEINETVHYKHAGVGSGINLGKILESLDMPIHNNNYDLSTTGHVNYSIGWQKTALIKKDPLGEQIGLLKDITNKNLSVNVSKLSEWMVQSVPDPQDPRNVVFFEYMEGYEPKLLKNNNFR